MKCPSNINDLMKALAELLDEKFVEHDEEYDEGPSVTVDSYAVVWWDNECEAIGFTPALHPFTFRDEDEDEGTLHMWDHFIISEDELKKMSYDMSFIPPLDRPMPQREGKTEEEILLDKEQLIAELNSNTQ